jgi:pimeloyl-ACP methyl ester carboxylesterase
VSGAPGAARSGSVEAAGVELAYEESGSGPPVLLVHGLATDRRLWRETVDLLGDGVRLVAYDRRGHGDSGAPEPYEGTTVEEQAEDAAALLGELGAAPAVLCGHDFGALVCLDLVVRHPQLARAAVLIEPPLFSLSEHGIEAATALREAAEEGARDSGPAGLAEAVIRWTAGPNAAEVLGAERWEVVRGSARLLALELPAQASWDFSRRGLRSLETPVTVVAGAESQAVWRDSARALAELVPGSELGQTAGGHFVPVEQPADVAEAILERG